MSYEFLNIKNYFHYFSLKPRKSVPLIANSPAFSGNLLPLAKHLINAYGKKRYVILPYVALFLLSTYSLPIADHLFMATGRTIT